jgi:hypothetical protein
MIHFIAADAGPHEGSSRVAATTPHVKALLLVAMVFLLSHRLAHAQTLTISDQNSNLTLTRANPGFSGAKDTNDNLVQLSEKLEWTVDGRRILVYPGLPSGFIDIGHWHPGLHVGPNQIHAQGSQFGYTTTEVTGGTVYTVIGSAPGSGVSRISEKTDIYNKTGSSITIYLTGMGFKPTQASLEVPDFTGLNVTGTTVVFSQGDTVATDLTDGPSFAPAMVLRAFSFTGFNPLLGETVSLGPNGTLTIVTELRVERAPYFVQTILWILVAVIFAGAIAMLVWRRRGAQDPRGAG